MSRISTYARFPTEPEVEYDSTVWWDVYPHRPGNLTVVVRSSTFGPVVGVMPFDLAAPQRPNAAESHCDAAGGLGQVTLNYRFRLKEGAAYTTQVGVPTLSGTPGALRHLLPLRRRYRP